MKTLEEMTRWDAGWWEKENVTRDCISEFKELWASAAPPERTIIRDMIVDGEEQSRTNCPHVKILELYHEILPMLRQVKVYTTTRRSHVAQRWRDMRTVEEWEIYFRLVAKCPLLIGEGDSWNGRTWKADFDWLINPQNFAKVVEGKYEK